MFHRCKKCNDILKVAYVGRDEHVSLSFFTFSIQLCHQRSLQKCHYTFYIYGPLGRKVFCQILKSCLIRWITSLNVKLKADRPRLRGISPMITDTQSPLTGKTGESWETHTQTDGWTLPSALSPCFTVDNEEKSDTGFAMAMCSAPLQYWSPWSFSRCMKHSRTPVSWLQVRKDTIISLIHSW